MNRPFRYEELERMTPSELDELLNSITDDQAINSDVGGDSDAEDDKNHPSTSKIRRVNTDVADIAKVVSAPVIHANGDNPEAVVHAANIAAEWRATWQKDIFIDIVAYRRLGHNESDEPMFTQPKMYSKIRSTKSISELYAEKLISEGVVNSKEVEDTKQKYEKLCEAAAEKAKTHKIFNPLPWVDNRWSADAFKDRKQELPITGIPEDVIKHILNVISSGAPQGFVLHKGYDRILKGRRDLYGRKIIDWSMAEACAFGSLLREGIPVRAGGQDFQRGTFSHRHYVYHHQTTEAEYIPLANLYKGQGIFTPVNSVLSEYAVLGFEFGYSQCNPNALCVWEAQFGDFQNTAQCMIDCFVSNTREKWLKESGLVINLPHGLEGMGADHSSARPERFLVQCKDDPNKFSTDPGVAFQQLKDCNWIVCQVTTPANMFHVYRRQVHLPFRRPLINFIPKSLLRVPAARSAMDDIKDGTQFLAVIPDPVDPAGVKKVSFSVGKVYYDLLKARAAKKLDKEIALVRIEQVNPFPYDLLAPEIAKYPNAKFVFVQEEHINHGYHQFVVPRLRNLLPGKEIKVIARGPAAGGAPAMVKTFTRQLVALMKQFIES
ncbi:2-oxoglutarate dehydrogenase [Holotrichia oblita]|uniref:2-oxoglutarate dehydrogenase n=1 Tax=Holotrichia oblita TaxID=644536 RepID=A0ACB9SNI9_HOLOL|nr:2-oxoglutarate dehydrogenase [Holotrichia oblita]